jgi:hypothetical protein
MPDLKLPSRYRDTLKPLLAKIAAIVVVVALGAFIGWSWT